jgi:hypothetical protein
LTADTHFAPKSLATSASRCKIAISLFLTDRNAFSARGSTQNHLNAYQFSFGDRDECGATKARQNHRTAKIAILAKIETKFVGKDEPSTSPHCHFTSIFDDRHFVREGYVSWTSIRINPCCPAALRENFGKVQVLEAADVFKKLISTCSFASATVHLRMSIYRCFREIDLRLRLYICRNTPAYIYVAVVLKKMLCTCTYAPAGKNQRQ